MFFTRSNIKKIFYLLVFFGLFTHSSLTGIFDLREVVKNRFNVAKVETEYDYFVRIKKSKNDIFISNISDITLNVMKYAPYIMYFTTKNPIIVPFYSISITTSATICFVLKKIFKEPRPDDCNKKNSFPSGHSTIAFVGFACIFLIYRKYKFGKVIISLMFFVAMMTAICRVLCHRHWVVDACCGSLIGIFVSLLVYYFYVVKRKV